MINRKSKEWQKQNNIYGEVHLRYFSYYFYFANVNYFLLVTRNLDEPIFRASRRERETRRPEYIKLLSYSTKRQIYDEIFCSFRSLQLLDPGLGPSLFGRDLTLVGYESGLGFGSLASGSSSPKWE